MLGRAADGFKKKTALQYRPAELLVHSDELHRHGFSGLAGGQDRHHGHRSLPACVLRDHALRHAGHFRHPLCLHKAGLGGDRRGKLRRDPGGYGPVSSLCRVFRLCGGGYPLVPGRACGLSLDRGRQNGRFPAHLGFQYALYLPLLRLFRLFYRLRQSMEAHAGASGRAAGRDRSGGPVSGDEPGGGH